MVTSRVLFTAKQKDELWERWKNGQSVLAISRALEKRRPPPAWPPIGVAPAPPSRAGGP